MAKVEPLYDLLNKKIQQFGIAHEELSIDESMVLYYGHHSCKQYIRAKPIRFGYKLWELASVKNAQLSKMLWKFVKIQKITAITLTTSFQAVH